MSLLPRLSLRSILIAINLTVLALPLAGIQLLRLYESALVRQTESALIAQAAFVASFYRTQVKQLDSSAWRNSAAPLTVAGTDGRWSPRLPELDLASSPRLAPFPDGVSRKTAVTFARQVGDSLIPVLKDAQLVTLAGIRLVDPNGVIVASTGDDTGLSVAHGDEIAAALAGRASSQLRVKSDVTEVSGLDSISRTTGIRVFVASPITLDDHLIGAVMLSRTPNNIIQALYGKRWLLLRAFVLLVGIVLVATVLTFRLIANPVRELVDEASRIARGEEPLPGEHSRPAPRTREFARLHHAIMEMAEVLEQRAAYLQEFSRHISHEFKTPIASIRGAVEVLQDHHGSMAPDQFDKFLNNIADDAQRMQRLTERLLELARADMQALSAEPTPVKATLREAAAPYLAHLEMNTDELPGDAEVATNPQALQAALEILLENALQHGASEIRVHLRETAGNASLLVTNNGTEIDEANREQIFEPFFTTVRASGGTGLGLSIARTLMRQAGGDLCLHDAGETTTFEIRFAQGH